MSDHDSDSTLDYNFPVDKFKLFECEASTSFFLANKQDEDDDSELEAILKKYSKRDEQTSRPDYLKQFGENAVGQIGSDAYVPKSSWNDLTDDYFPQPLESSDEFNVQDHPSSGKTTVSSCETVGDRLTSSIQPAFPKAKRNFNLSDEDDCYPGTSTSSSYQSSTSKLKRSKLPKKMSWNDLSDDDCIAGPSVRLSQENINRTPITSQQFSKSMNWSDSIDEDDCKILSPKLSNDSDEPCCKATSILLRPITSKHEDTSDDDSPSISLLKHLKESKDKINGSMIIQDLLQKYKDQSENSNSQAKHPITSGKNTNSSSELKKIEKEKLRLAKLEKRELAKAEGQKDKEIKKLASLQERNLKPDECIKFLTVQFDSNFENETYFSEAINSVQELGSRYKIMSNVIPYSITWSREKQAHFMNDNGQLAMSAQNEEIKHILLILSWKEIVKMIDHNSFVAYIHSIQEVNPGKRVSLGLFGLENYFKYWKNEKNREHKAKIANVNQSKNKFDKYYQDFPRISRRDLELILTELQILFTCCARFLESSKDVGLMISNFTKSIAQTPYKLEKQRKQQELDKYLIGDNKDCVKIDKFGNGLQRLWKQQLTTFPLGSLETAEAVISKYPTLRSLMEAYENTNDGEHMMQNIPIRRAAGPFSSVRNLGPEFSKKMYKYFTSLDEDTVL